MAIDIRMAGGLGNQLFQLNAAWYLKKFFSNNSIYIYPFCLTGYRAARSLSLQPLISSHDKILIRNKFSLLPLFFFQLRPHKVFPDLFPYVLQNASQCLSLGKDSLSYPQRHVFLDGYFQDYRIVCDDFCDFVLDSFVNDINLPFQIEPDSVAMHIRRGDYTSSQNSSIYNQLGIDYYDRAYDLIGSCQNLYVFSDDKKAASFYSSRYEGIDVSLLSLSYIQEFLLMSLCPTIIIANSTFSWWASRLLPSGNKKVVAPANWFIRYQEGFNLISPKMSCI